MRAAIPSSVLVLIGLVGLAHSQVSPPRPFWADAVQGTTTASGNTQGSGFAQGLPSSLPFVPNPAAVKPSDSGKAPGSRPANGPGVAAMPGQIRQVSATAEAEPVSGSTKPSPLGTGAGQVSGIITYTYYTGTQPTGQPLPGPPVDAGTYTVVATFKSSDGNYTGGSSATTFTIQKATPRISVQGGGGTYNGAPFPVTGFASTPGTMNEGAVAAPVPVDLAGVPIPKDAGLAGNPPMPRSSRDLRLVADKALPMPGTQDSIAPELAEGGNPMVHELDGPPPGPGNSVGGTAFAFTEPCTAPRFWFTGEYLMWWIKDSPLPFPVVTTSTNPGTNTSGALGDPGTAVLYGGQDVSFGLFSGLQIGGGAWIDQDATLGVEGQIFFLQSRSDTFNAGSNNAGSPPLYLPAFNTQLQAERALILADPVSGLAGNVSVVSSSELWGAEVAGLLNVMRTNCLSVNLLGGFRYLDLDESFELSNTTRNVDGGFVDSLRDQFQTTNRFYGALLGARFCYTAGPWLVSVAEKLAIGSTHEVITIAGATNESGAGAPTPGTFLGGFYAQPTNIGRREDSRFSVVPELQLKVGYRLSPNVSGFLGYNFIYWTGVARPGDQIDRNLNLSQSPIFGTTGGVLVGTASPRPLSNPSDFWTQGLSLGLAITY